MTMTEKINMISLIPDFAKWSSSMRNGAQSNSDYLPEELKLFVRVLHEWCASHSEKVVLQQAQDFMSTIWDQEMPYVDEEN